MFNPNPHHTNQIHAVQAEAHQNPQQPGEWPNATKPKPEQQREFDNVHVYAKSAALTFKAVKNRNGVPTVNIDAAKANVNGSGYNWKQGVQNLQLKQDELIGLIYFLTGQLKANEFEVTNHITEDGLNKAFKVHNQNGGVLWNQHQSSQNFNRNAGVVVPIGTSDIIAVISLLLRQLTKALKLRNVDSTMALLNSQTFRL